MCWYIDEVLQFAAACKQEAKQLNNLKILIKFNKLCGRLLIKIALFDFGFPALKCSSNINIVCKFACSGGNG